ncbi:hypothetical protein B7494_g6885 [Chlorociboria aeruginascens]|nr:hypothetical protein B7494_g6885 [Chlorociboria aeruginascens]
MRLSSSLLLLQGAVALAHESVAIVTATEPETIVKCTTYVTQEVVTYLTTLYPHGTTGTVSTPHGESTSSFSGYRNPSKSSKYPPVESTSSSTSYPPKTETHRGHSTPRVSASTWKFHNSTSSLFSSTTSLSSLSTSSSSVVTSGSLITSTSQNSTSSTSSASQNSTSSTSTYIPQSTGCPLDACATEVRSNLDDCSSLLLVTVYPSTITATAYITLSNSSLFFTTPTSTETFTETEYPFTAISSTTSTILESTTVSTSVSTSLTTVTTSTQTMADIVTTTVTTQYQYTPILAVEPCNILVLALVRGSPSLRPPCQPQRIHLPRFYQVQIILLPEDSGLQMRQRLYLACSSTSGMNELLICLEITSFTTEVFVTSIVRFTETDSTIITSDVLASTTVTSTSSSIVIVTPTASANAVCENGAFVDGLSASCPEAPCNSYNLRIEGDTDTIYEGIILAGPRTITTASGGTHLCDGTNGGANTVPGGTSTSAMDAATGLCGFVYDGSFDTAFDDYFITSISDSAETSTMFWGLLNNFQFAPYGGCGNEPSPGDSILWAYDAFNKASFLDVSPSTASLSVGEIAEFTVIDGSTGTLVSGATFNGLLSNAEGVVPYVAREPGTFRLKASKSNAIRSPVVVITVS